MSKIEWTNVTWNPVTGCDKVSPGCGLARPDSNDKETGLTGGCYAMTTAKRLKAMGQPKYQNDGDPRTSGPGFGVTAHPGVLGDPLTWQQPNMVFVNSMSDLFHDSIPDEFIARVFAVMAGAPQHTFQILTKRHGRMRSLLNSPNWRGSAAGYLRTEYRPGLPLDKHDALTLRWIQTGELPNVWLGVSVEEQKWADIRIPALLGTPAAVRFLSCEPLLGPVNLYEYLYPTPCSSGCGCRRPHDPDARECGCDGECCMDPAWPYDSGIHWVIAGGESGAKARPMHPRWPADLRDQCALADVPFFFKQWGVWVPEYLMLHGRTARAAFQDADGRFRPLVNGKPEKPPMARGQAVTMRRVTKHRAGRTLDGRTHDEYPDAAV